MSILPEIQGTAIAYDTSLNQQKPPTKTYAVSKNKIKGYVEGKEAILQAIEKIIQTERYQHLIYSWDYGIELFDLFGKDKNYVIADIQRRFEEAILQNVNVISISDFIAESIDNDTLQISFVVDTEFGDVLYESEVSLTRENKRL